MRTIDADAALKALRKCQTYLYDARDPELKIELSSAEAAIKELPTIQPEKAQLSPEDTTSDLISRQAARHALCNAVHKGEDVPCENQTASCLWTGTRVCDFVREIDALPSVQPEPTYEQVEEYCKKRCLHVVTADFFESTKPQRLGHWIKHIDPFDGEQYECSECGVLWEFTEGTPEDNEAYYCPKCGAKMTISTK